jgi:hypothetical protein
VKLYSFYCCLILWSLLKCPSAGAQDKSKEIGDSKELTGKATEEVAEEPTEEPTDEPLVETLAPLAAERSMYLSHENSLWNAFIKPGDGDQRAEHFLLDTLSWTERTASDARSHQYKIDWNLGLGGGTSAFAEAGAALTKTAKVGRHSLKLDLSLDGAFIQRSEFQTLDKQYSEASRASSDVEDAPPKDRQTHRLGRALGLADEWAVQPDLKIGADAYQRDDDFRVTEAVDDRARFSQLGFSLRKTIAPRVFWDASLRLSELHFESRLQAFRQTQNLSEASSSFLFPLVGRYGWGLGYIAYELRDTRALRGPTLTLLREPDERLNWRATLNYLNGPGNEHIFGELIGAYRLTRLQSLQWQALRNVDLFSSFGVITSNRLPLTAPQDSNLRTSLSYVYDAQRDKFELRAAHSQANFLDAKVREQSVEAVWTQRINRVDSTDLGLKRRRNQELGSVFTETERNYLDLAYGWKHRMEGSGILNGARPFFHLRAAYESISDKLEDYNLERMIFQLGVGQEWL